MGGEGAVTPSLFNTVSFSWRTWAAQQAQITQTTRQRVGGEDLALVWAAAQEALVTRGHPDHPPPHSSTLSRSSPSTLLVPCRGASDWGLYWGLVKSAHKS